MEWNHIQGRDLAESPPRASGASGMRLFKKLPVGKVFRGTGNCVTGRPPDLEGKNKVMSGQDSLIERSPVRSRPGQVPAGARGLDGQRNTVGGGGWRDAATRGGFGSFPATRTADDEERHPPAVSRRRRAIATRAENQPQSLQPTRPSASRKGYQLCYGPDPCWWPSPSRRARWGALNATRVMTSRSPCVGAMCNGGGPSPGLYRAPLYTTPTRPHDGHDTARVRVRRRR